MFVAADDFLHGVDVGASLMGKRRRADPWLTRVVSDIRDFIDELGYFFQFGNGLFRQTFFPHFQRQTGNDARQVAVAGTFAVTVDHV